MYFYKPHSNTRTASYINDQNWEGEQTHWGHSTPLPLNWAKCFSWVAAPSAGHPGAFQHKAWKPTASGHWPPLPNPGAEWCKGGPAPSPTQRQHSTKHSVRRHHPGVGAVYSSRQRYKEQRVASLSLSPPSVFFPHVWFA